MLVKEIMSKRKIAVSPDDSLATAAQKMRDHDIGALLVEDQEHLCGMVTDRDIACRGFVPGYEATELVVRDVMTRHVVYCTESDHIDKAVLVMERNKIRRMPVVNTNNRTVGILSVGDIATHLPHALSGELIAAISTPLVQSPTVASLR